MSFIVLKKGYCVARRAITTFGPLLAGYQFFSEELEVIISQQETLFPLFFPSNTEKCSTELNYPDNVHTHGFPVINKEIISM